ncbi:unnamed protein product, partial [Mesorhabditis belari]|uniref:Trimethyllysine dioxygenase, mitochondrial n=1 Tax=Mesorhabditis belari TaxID=2138241 RepID=A0AAF3F6N7_9BILA
MSKFSLFYRKLATLAQSRAIPQRIARVSTIKREILPKSGQPSIFLEFDSGENLCVPLIWLRDHCRAEHSFNHSTHQRKHDCIGIFTRSLTKTEKLENESIQINPTGGLTINWADGLKSNFSAEELIKWAMRKPAPPSAQLHTWWIGKKMQDLPRIELSQFSMDKFVNLFCRFGFVMIDGVPATAEETEALCRRVGIIHDTFFGAFWVFSNKSQERSETEEFHEDTAYTSEGIGPHTDGTYFQQSPGIQVFHCLQPATSGGETILLDAFAAADYLKEIDAQAHKTLTTQKIDHHYLESNNRGNDIYSYTREYPVIETDSNGIYRQIRFNPYDRAPMQSLSESIDDAEKVVDFYKAYESYSRIILDKDRQLKVMLNPGTVIFIDNFRLLHARTEFQGDRTLCGTYMSRDDFFARARPFLPINHRAYYA